MVSASDLCSAAKDMLSEADYLFPLVAAEQQYRRHYYQLNAAALLEDLFFDALGGFLAKTGPDLLLEQQALGRTRVGLPNRRGSDLP